MSWNAGAQFGAVILTARDNGSRMVSLVAPDVGFETSYREAMGEFVAEGRRAELRALPDHATFESFVDELHAQSRGRDLPPGWVAGTTFWLVDGDGFIGKVELRHRLTEALRLRGGHVGYSIRPTMRRRGFGTIALAMVLPHCLALGLERVLVTCDETNVGSRRIIEANGGRLEDVVHVDDGPVGTMRFWIDVRARSVVARRSDAQRPGRITGADQGPHPAALCAWTWTDQSGTLLKAVVENDVPAPASSTVGGPLGSWRGSRPGSRRRGCRRGRPRSNVPGVKPRWHSTTRPGRSEPTGEWSRGWW